MNLKRVMIVALLACVALGAFGAGQAENARKVEISFLNFFVRGTDAVAAGADPRIQQFKADHPEVVLNEESLGFSDALTKLKSLGAAGSLPDLFIPNIPMAKEWSAAGLLRPIDDVLAADAGWKNGFLAGALDEFKFDGKTYGIPPWRNINGIVFYNDAIFKKCGINEFPKTWSAFLDAVKTLKANGYIPWTTFGKTGWGFSSNLSVLNYSQFGAKWFAELANGKKKFTDPEFLASLDQLKKLQELGAFNDDLYSMDGTQARAYYLNGKAAMSIDGTWAVALINANAPADVRDATKIAYLPNISGAAGKVVVPAGGGWGLCMSAKIKDAAKVKAVGTLMKYISDSAFGESLLYAGVYPSSMPKSYSAEKLSPLSVQYMGSLSKVDAGLFWDLSVPSAVIDKLEVELELFMLGKTAAADVAKTMQAFVESQK